MKKTMIWPVFMILLLLAAVVQADPIQDNSLNNYKAGWYPNYYKQKGPMTCPETCKIWIQGVPEQEMSMAAKTKKTNVCKFSYSKPINKPVRGPGFLYGNQFDSTPICYAADMSNKPQKSEKYYCLCIAKTTSGCNGSDLIVAKIEKPEWDSTNARSVIKAVIKNIGSSGAGKSIARVIDPSYLQTGGAPYNATANTPALAAGASTTVTFYLPYWVYNPDAELEVTADYKNVVKECNEKNNSKKFSDKG
ncbi:MAG: CARDB domain-containing protein [Pseudomonadota bacterium]